MVARERNIQLVGEIVRAVPISAVKSIRAYIYIYAAVTNAFGARFEPGGGEEERCWCVRKGRRKTGRVTTDRRCTKTVSKPRDNRAHERNGAARRYSRVVSETRRGTIAADDRPRAVSDHSER